MKLVVAAAVSTSLLAWLAQQQPPIYRTSTTTVSVFATVTDKDGRLVPDLTADDFFVFDNGRPQPITLFNAGDQPITTVVMVDMSGSMAPNVSRVRAGAVQFFTRLLPADKARVGIIVGREPKLNSPFTNDLNDLIRALWIDADIGDGTPLWSGVNLAMSALAEPKPGGRRVVLVLSDGYDTESRRFPPPSPLDLLIQRTQSEDVMVYAIGLKATAGSVRTGQLSHLQFDPDPGLRVLALESGGWYFELLPDDDLGATFARVADELHRQYELGYRVPAFDGKIHQIEVQVTKPGLKIRARKSYQAPARVSHPSK